MFDAWWLRLGSTCPPPCRGRPRHCRRSPSWAPRLTVGTIMITDWRLARRRPRARRPEALVVDVPVVPRKRSGSALLPLYLKKRPQCCAAVDGQSVPTPDVSNCGKLREQRLDLLDHLVGEGEHARWNSDAKHFCGFEIDQQFETRGLLNGYVIWLGPFENFVHDICRASVHIR